MTQPRLVDFDECDVTYVVIADGVAIQKGDLITYESSTAIQMAAANKDDYFIGVADQDKVASDGQTKLRVVTAGKLEVDVTSATYIVGDELKWTSANALVASGAATGIARVWRLPSQNTVTGTATRLIVDFVTDKYWKTLSA